MAEKPDPGFLAELRAIAEAYADGLLRSVIVMYVSRDGRHGIAAQIGPGESRDTMIGMAKQVLHDVTILD